MQNKERARLAREKEGNFLLAYFGKDSKTRDQRGASAIAAGYLAARAVWNANRILDKYADLLYRDSTQAIGLTKPKLAVKHHELLETLKGKDKLQALRLLLANMGEATDNALLKQGPVVNMPVMVIVGATDERMIALRRGSDPVRELPPPFERDAIDAEVIRTVEEPTSPPIQPKPPEERALEPKPGDFTGRNRGDVGKRP